MYKHDPQIEEQEVDSQTTVWLASCKKCGRKCRPLYSKHDAVAAFEEKSCPLENGPAPTETTAETK